MMVEIRKKTYKGTSATPPSSGVRSLAAWAQTPSTADTTRASRPLTCFFGKEKSPHSPHNIYVEISQRERSEHAKGVSTLAFHGGGAESTDAR